LTVVDDIGYGDHLVLHFGGLADSRLESCHAHGCRNDETNFAARQT